MNVTSIVIVHSVPFVILAGLMVVSMPDTFIEPVKAAYTGLLMIFR